MVSRFSSRRGHRRSPRRGVAHRCQRPHLRHERRLERAQRAWEAARRAHFAGDIDRDTFVRDKEHYERELAMLTSELERMRRAEQANADREAVLAQVAAISSQWAEINAALTPEEKREIVWALVRDVTVSKADDVVVTGTLTALPCSNRFSIGSA